MHYDGIVLGAGHSGFIVHASLCRAVMPASR